MSKLHGPTLQHAIDRARLMANHTREESVKSEARGELALARNFRLSADCYDMVANVLADDLRSLGS